VFRTIACGLTRHQDSLRREGPGFKSLPCFAEAPSEAEGEIEGDRLAPYEPWALAPEGPARATEKKSAAEIES
jgi:hypothetical protein